MRRAALLGLLGVSAFVLVMPDNSTVVAAGRNAGIGGKAPARATSPERQALLDSVYHARQEAALAQAVRKHIPIQPRQRLPKLDDARLVRSEGTTDRLIVKFADEVQARAEGGRLVSRKNANMGLSDAIIQQFQLQVSCVFAGKTEGQMNQLETRIADHSRRAAPDFCGMMYVTGPADTIEEAARAINALPDVEFVEFEQKLVPMGETEIGCCLPPDLGGVCVSDTIANCAAAGGTIVGEPEVCGQVDACWGACCFPNDPAGPSCDFRSFNACVLNMGPEGSGLPQGAGIQCDDPLIDCGDAGPGLPGACCIPSSGACQDATLQEECEMPIAFGGLGGIFMGEGIDCTGLDCDIACGAPTAGDCFEVHVNPTCDNEACCEQVCALDPFCCELDDPQYWPERGSPGWDIWCVTNAFLLCQGTFPGGVTPGCGVPNSGSCFESNASSGCDQGFCCELVCAQLPLCCDFDWDSNCVSKAFELCTDLDGNEELAPNLTSAQGYYTFLDYATEHALATGAPCPDPKTGCLGPDCYPSTVVATLPFLPDLECTERLLPGYEGQGYDMQGLWEFGENLRVILEDEGESIENLSRGKSIKVGVIEHAAFADWQAPNDPTKTHEDLIGKVQPEQGQTIPIIPTSENINGHHGTACLGIIGAVDHDELGNAEPQGLSPDQSRADEVGMVGLAPDAELYFFPIVSVQEPGGRLLNAIASAMLEFGPGDVLSYSIGPGDSCGTLCTSAANWVMINAAASLGITNCIAAGNSSCNLDDSEAQQAFGDSGAIIVGAVYPGGLGTFNNYCRSTFSNYCEDCSIEDGGAVHIAAWGEKVATLGYGELHSGSSNPSSFYTATFNGTSAACPQVAALVACLQGISKMMYDDLALTPFQIRGTLTSGFFQCGLENPPGSTNPDFGDWDRDGDPARVGNTGIVYTSPTLAAERVITTPYFDGNPLFDSIQVVRGEPIFGNSLSVKADDQNYFVVESEMTQAGNGPEIPSVNSVPVGVIADITYIVSGQITDVVVAGTISNKNTRQIRIVYEMAPTFQGLHFVEVYDWVARRWFFTGFDTTLTLPPGPDGDVGNGFTINRPAAKIRDDGTVAVRLWAVGFGGGEIGPGAQGGGSFPFDVNYDVIRIEQSQGFGQFFDN